MTKLLHILFILLFALAPCVCMRAQVLDINATCETAPLITNTFSASVPAAGDYWISAWTYDLPLNLVFTPTIPLLSAPIAVLDFRCGDGRYPTQELQDFFFPPSDGNATFRIEMPATLVFRQNTNNTYSFAIPESYREMMFQAGLTEDVQAYIKIHFPSAGSVDMNPSEDFRDCVGEGIENWTMLGDTIQIDPATVDDQFYIFPYMLWRNDSIHFVWTGDEQLVLWLGKDCNFFPDPTDEYFLDYIVIDPEESNEFKYSIEEVRSFIKGFEPVVPEGLFYVRFTSDVAGQLIVEKTPLAEVQGGAIELHLDEPVIVPDSNQLYYFQRTIGGALQFTTPSFKFATAYFSVDEEYVLPTADSIVFVSLEADGRMAGLMKDDLSSLATRAANANSPYIYVRFVCEQPMEVTMTRWDNECATKVEDLPLNTRVSITASKNYVYKIYYPAISGEDFTLKWTPSASKAMNIYIADTCDYNSMSLSEHRLWNKSIAATATTQKITAATIDTWAARVDADGYIYIRMNSSAAGRMQFTTTKEDEEYIPPYVEPEVIDPIYPETPEPEWTGTIRLACEEENVMRVEVSVEQTLLLYEVGDHNATSPRPLPTLIEQWTQAPGDTPHELNLEAEHTYMLKGQDATIRIRR